MTNRISRSAVWRFFALYLLACPLLIAQPKQPAMLNRLGALSEIRGRITLSRTDELHDEQWRAGLFGRYAAHGGKDPSLLISPAGRTPLKLSEKAVVYLESDELDRGRYSVSQKNPVLDQRDLQFHPQVLPILAGTTVDFPNRDNLFHNVFSYSQPKEFDLGRYPVNDSRSVTFQNPGVVRVYCDIHSHMSATILVLMHPYFAAPDDDGTYVIPNVPEGKYTVVLWYRRDVVERRMVTVIAGESIEMNFTY